LRVIVDELGEWGYVEVITGGKWDCIGLTQNVLEVEKAAERASMLTGRPISIQGIPCQLKREPRTTSCPPLDGKGPRVRLEKWMLYLYVHPEFNQALMREMGRYSLPMAYAPQLEAPADLEVDYYVGNGDEEGIEHPETEVVDEPETMIQPDQPPQAEPTKAELEATKQLFYGRVIKEIPFYHNAQAIGQALKVSGFTAYAQTKEAEMLAALQKHAHEKANKEAA
jgi:hypothetical protein